jgi:urease accessory protein
LSAEGLLAAFQLADSSLPIGRFVHSIGLERWLAERPEAGPSELTELIATFLSESVGPLDATAVALAHRARTLGDLADLDELISAFKPLAPQRAASRACGRQLAALGLKLTGDELATAFCRLVDSGRTDGNLPVLEGLLARALEVSEPQAVLIELRGAAVGLVSAAIRLGRLSSAQAQVILLELSPVIVEAQVEALAREVLELYATSPELDIAALAHRRADVRLFAT